VCCRHKGNEIKDDICVFQNAFLFQHMIYNINLMAAFEIKYILKILVLIFKDTVISFS
jgi:hypothetical protein